MTADPSDNPTWTRLANRFARLWQESEGPPDVFRFLEAHPNASGRERAEVLKVDLRRWRLLGKPRRVEEYCEKLPDLAREHLLDIVECELECLEGADIDGILERFPELAEELRQRLLGPRSGAPTGSESPPPALSALETEVLGDSGSDGRSEVCEDELSSDEYFALTSALREWQDARAAPERIGKYPIRQTLAIAGFKEVYLARHPVLDCDVVVKLARPGVDFVLNEARILATLIDTPGVVRVLDAGVADDGRYYLVEQWVAGTDLAVKIHENRPSHFQSAELVSSVAEALHCAHTHGVFHRDIKPANILIDRAGRPFVTDFGLALTVQDFGNEQKQGGTVAYMSPEQTRGEGHLVDGRTDVYSLGVVFYELLTGARPFTGSSVSEVVERVTRLEARPPRQLDDSIPAELERICLKALSKRAADRYTTALDMAEDLRVFLRSASGETAESRGSDAWRSRLASIESEQAMVIPKGLRSFEEEDAEFFLELLPGPRDREGMPDSVRFWKTRIETSDPDRTLRVGLLYGSSGCGKSSLVKAGLIPRLGAEVKTIYVEATRNDLASRLLRRLQRSVAECEGVESLSEALARIRRGGILPEGHKVLLVIDQFEQWLHGEFSVETSELIQALRQCDGRRLQCLLLTRDDFWMAATRFMRELEIPLVQGENCAPVDLFDLRHARKVLTAFGRAYRALPEHESPTPQQQRFLDHALADLAEDGRVIPVRLALLAQMMKSREWSPRALREMGGTLGVGVRFLEESFDAPDAPPEHRYHQNAARPVLRAVLPEPGEVIRGRARSRQELLELSGYLRQPREFDDLMRVLDSELRLLTPVDLECASDGTAGWESSTQKRYELTHDYLVPALREWLTRRQRETRRGRAQLRLAERTVLWLAKPERRQLPSPWEWTSIELLTRKRYRSPAEMTMLRAARLHHLSRAAIVFVASTVVIWGSLLGYGRLNARANSDRILGASPGDVAGIVAELGLSRGRVYELLRESVRGLTRTSPSDPKKLLNARLALVGEDPGQVPHLREFLLDAEPENLRIIVGALRDRPTVSSVVAQLWSELEGDAPVSRSFRAACALAHLDPGNRNWAVHAARVVAMFPPGKPQPWAEILRPVHDQLSGAMLEVYRRGDSQARRVDAGVVLGEWRAGDPAALVALVEEAEPAQLAALVPVLSADREEVVRHLRQLSRRDLAGAWDSQRSRAAVVNTAAALAVLRETNAGWELLRHAEGRDPSLRSLLIHRVGPSGVEPGAITERLFDPSVDLSIRRALALALGTYSRDLLPAASTRVVVAKLVEMYRAEEDPGLHSAVEWLLRQWREGAALDAAAETLVSSEPPRGRRWFINGAGQTMAVLGPATFLMGRPGTTDASDVGDRGARTIPRTYAITTTEVTVGQYRRFCQEQGRADAYEKERGRCAPSPNCSMVYVSTQDMLEYCNWLSDREGVEQCYVEIDGKLEPAKDWSERSGYRLPTAAEWEYAARAATTTACFFGDVRELYDFYTWHENNSEGRTREVGQLKPNDFGLFDVLGNVGEVCHRTDESNAPVGFWERGQSRAALPSHFKVFAPYVPYTLGPASTLGFRVVRTLSADGQGG